MQFEYGTLFALGAEGMFYLLLLFFTFHVFFLGFHWFSYGTSKSISLIALATYLCGAAVFFIILSILLTQL
jgi:hypothetical protein